MRFGAVLSLALIQLPFGQPAFAYIPPSDFIAKNISKKHAGFKGVRVATTVRAFDDGKPTATFFKQTTWVDYATKTLKSVAKDEQGKELYVVDRSFGEFEELPPEPESARPVQPANTPSAPALPRRKAVLPDSSAPVMNYLLFEARPEFVAEALRASGVPIRTEDELLLMKDEDERRASEIAGLRRWMKTFAWVLGVSKKESTPAQLWIEKDAFLPLRYVAKSDSKNFDLRFEGFRYFKEFPFPRLISFVRPDSPAEAPEIIFQEEMNEVAVNPSLKDLKKFSTPGFSEAGNMADEKVRDLIQAYYQVLR